MGSRTPTFTELVGDEEEFFARYFTKRPLFRPGALAGDVARILSIADMDDIVHQEGLRSSLFRMLGHGVGAAGPALTRRLHLRREGRAFDDALDADRVYAHFRSGKTLIHAGLNHTRPNLRRLCAILTEKFGAPSEAVAFLTPAGSQAGGPHSDPSDVYIIQLAGTKRWQVWPTPDRRRVGEDCEYDPTELPDPVLDLTLRPGDVLYLPYGTPHVAFAEEDVSLHLTLVALTPMWSELLLRVLDDLLADHDEFWPVPYPGDSPAALDAALKEQIGALMTRLDRLDTAEALRRVVSAGRAYAGVVQGSYFQEMAAVGRLGQDAMVVMAPESTTFHAATDGVALVTVDGNTVKMPERTASALRATSTGAPVRAGDFLPGADGPTSLASVRRLIRLGALSVVDDHRE